MCSSFSFTEVVFNVFFRRLLKAVKAVTQPAQDFSSEATTAVAVDSTTAVLMVASTMVASTMADSTMADSTMVDLIMVDLTMAA